MVKRKAHDSLKPVIDSVCSSVPQHYPLSVKHAKLPFRAQIRHLFIFSFAFWQSSSLHCGPQRIIFSETYLYFVNVYTRYKNINYSINRGNSSELSSATNRCIAWLYSIIIDQNVHDFTNIPNYRSCKYV